MCQRVREAACYGSLGSCESPSQTCCRTTYQRVCQQVPLRVPVTVNVTIPGESVRKQDCSNVERTVPVYRTEMRTVYENSTREQCQPEKTQQCVNFTLPTFDTMKVDMEDRVELDTIRCHRQNRTRTYCHTFPGAKLNCRIDQVARRYIVNRVRCDQQRETNICRTIPWSRCVPNSGQECRMVQRTRCVSACSRSSQCARCDQMRQSGALAQPCSSPSGSCSKFFPRDSPAVTLPGTIPSAEALFSQPTAHIGAGASVGVAGQGVPEVGDDMTSQMY